MRAGFIRCASRKRATISEKNSLVTTFENKINLLHRIETFEDTEAHDQPQINKLKAWKKSNRGTKDACVTVPCRLRLLFTDSLKTQH